MATIQFKGKPAVWNHHLSVPYHTLEKDDKKSLKGANADENLIVQGDNLLALKALLPKYQGKVKCIYIDPPYNTGNEGWVYNDNVNSPAIRDWMGKAVGDEGEDLVRHDKWLCMMTPRLKLLRELLREDGVLFASIDDNEVQHLKMLLNEVFGEGNFVGEFVVIRAEGGGLAKQYVKGHDYLLAFAKRIEHFEPLRREKDIRGKIIEQDGKRYWLEEDWLRKEFGKYGTLPYEEIEKVKGKKKLKEIDDGIASGEYQLIEKKGGQHIVARLRLIEEDGSKFYSLLKHLSADGKNDLANLGLQDVFDYPKPVSLLKALILGATFSSKTEGDIILDSFAGSGTTAQAVLDLNKEDGGNRKFILVEMEDYANKTTAERVRLATKKNGYGAGFTYYTLGPAIDAETLLEGKKLPTFKEFAKYVYYLATGKNHPDESKISEKTGLVGKDDGASVYLLYEQDADALKKLAITLDWAQKTHEKDAGRKIVYAPACYLDDEALDQYNIRFVGIPYNLFERSI